MNKHLKLPTNLREWLMVNGEWLIFNISPFGRRVTPYSTSGEPRVLLLPTDLRRRLSVFRVCDSFRLCLLAFVCLGLVTTNAFAQDVDGGGGGGGGSYWKAVLTDGEFVVPHNAVSSFALSRYVVDGALRVHEVSIDTLGSVQARFYFLEEILPQSPIGVGQSGIDDLRSRVREAQDRLGAPDTGREVTKTHPLTTHAHTVEFILPDEDSVQRLFRSLEDSWIKRRTVTFRLES